jgi:hypothetical protein
MLARNIVRLLGIGLVLTFVAGGAFAQQTVYKWVDEEGVVHFGDAPPEGVTSERITTSAAPTPPQPAPAAAVPDVDEVAAPPPDVPTAASPPTVVATPIAEMSLSDLDNRCNDAREIEIAPLKSAEIERCKEQPRSDPAFCERSNADFGEGGRTITGAVRPRMFDTLPECVEALQERNRRGAK